MASFSLKNLYSEYHSNRQNEADFAIGFYEKNSLFLKNIKQFDDKEELRKYIELVGRYVDALYQKGHYTKVVDVVSSSQALLNEEILRLHVTHSDIKNTWYYHLGLIEGIACYNLRKYKTAISIFKNLIQVDGENDKYQNWLHSSRHAQWSLLVRIMGICFLSSMMVLLLLDKHIPYYNIGKIWIRLALLGMIFVALYEYFPHLFFRGKRK